MFFFFGFIFFLIGIISYLYSYFFLFLLPLPILYLFKFKNLKYKSFIYLVFTLFAIILMLLYPKGNVDSSINNIGIVIQSKSNYFIVLTLKGKFYVKNYNNSINFFTIFKIKGKIEELSFSHYESGFDFKNYLKSKGVFYALNITSQESIFKPINVLSYLKDWSLKYLNDDAKNLVSYLLFNESTSDLNQSLQNLNLFTLFSTSGLHLSFFIHIFETLLNKKKKNWIPIIKIIIVVLFLFITSFKVSIFRILIFSILLIINPHLKKKLSYLERISLCALILLVLNPFSLISQSFYYSFPFLFYLALTQNQSNKSKSISFIFLLFSFSLLLNSISDGGFNILSPLSHLIILPISHLLFILSICLLFIPFIGYLVNVIVKLILLIANFFDNYSIFIITGKPLIIFVIVFYVIFILISILKMYSFKKESNILKGALIISIVLLAVPDSFYHYELNIIDVDQGFSSLIRYKNYNFLIDTGGLIKTDLAINSLIPYLRKKKIRYLDAVILTHHDYDHYGALDSLNSNFPIKNIYWQTDFLSNENHSYYIGDLEIKNLNDYEISTDTNSTSGVYSFTIHNKHILMMGDAPIEIEKKLLVDKKEEIKCDYLVLGHHGSKTSSSFEFLKETNAKIAFITCGENNKYGFPNKEVISNLNKANIEYRRTDQEGTIKIKL